MKRTFLYIALTLVSFYSYALDVGTIPSNMTGQSFMFTHPATFDIAREQAMWHNAMYNENGYVKGALQVIPFYQKSTTSHDPINSLAGYFFPTCVSSVIIAGDLSQLATQRDIRAEWLGLPDNFSGVMTLCPEQQQYGAVIEYLQHASKFTSNRFLDYLWFSVTMPILQVKNNIRIGQRELVNEGSSFTSPNNIIEAFNQPDWDFDKIDGERKKTGLGEFKIKLGAALYAKDGFELDFYELLSFPTSDKNDPAYLFSPFLGSNHTWVVGTGGNFQFPITRKGFHTPILFFFNIEHQFLFQNKQLRTFDIRGVPWSRFMLYNSIDGTQVDVPGVNLLTRQVVVKPDSFVDLSTGFRIQNSGVEAEIGYDLWAHGQERIEFFDTVCPECQQQIILANFGIAGTQPGTSASNSTIAFQAGNDATFQRLTELNLDPTVGAAGAAICHRIHGSIGWSNLTPTIEGFLNIGAYAEFSQNNCAFNLWGFWGKVGAAF